MAESSEFGRQVTASDDKVPNTRNVTVPNTRFSAVTSVRHSVLSLAAGEDLLGDIADIRRESWYNMVESIDMRHKGEKPGLQSENLMGTQ